MIIHLTILVACCSFSLAEVSGVPVSTYLNHSEFTSALNNLIKSYPELLHVEKLGDLSSVGDVNIYKISHYSIINETRPSVLLVSNFDDDDIFSKHIILNLIIYILNSVSHVDSQVTSLVESVDLYFIPCWKCLGISDSLQCVEKDSSLKIDYVKFQSTPKYVQELSKWAASKPLALVGLIDSRNLPNLISEGKATATGNKSPEEFIEILSERLKKKENSYELDPCPKGLQVTGHLFNFLFSNALALSFDLNCCQTTPEKYLSSEFGKHMNGLMEFIGAASLGVHGKISFDTGEPIEGAVVEIVSGGYNVTSNGKGYYHRLLPSGQYSMNVHIPGYPIQQKLVTLSDGSLVTDIKIKRQNKTQGKVIKDEETPSETGFYSSIEFKHHNYTEMESTLIRLQKEYRSLTSLYSIGKSVEGRELYVMEISNNPGKHVPGNPEVKIIANMHGNEVVGREVCLLFIRYLCENYETDPRVTKILKTTRLHIMPSMNPDGYERARVGDYDSVIGRNNANDVDLNRNFPDQFGIFGTNVHQQPETLAVMQWLDLYPFVLSTNLHNGALVANYPYDDNKIQMDKVMSPSPDQKTFYLLAKVYADAHPRMHLSPRCRDSKEFFTGGVTNGAMWYNVPGGMQDYNYIYKSVMEITLELGCYKFPPADQLKQLWLENKPALLAYVEQAHRGIHGFVTNRLGQPIENALILVEGINKTVPTSKWGDYFRIIAPGNYNVIASAEGHIVQKKSNIVVGEDTIGIVVNFTLDTDTRHPISVDFDIPDNTYRVDDYLNNAAMRNELLTLDKKYQSFVVFKDDSLLPCLKISVNAAAANEDKFHIGIFGNFYSSEPTGREISLRLARALLNGLKVNNSNVVSLLSKSVLHIFPFSEEIVHTSCMSSTPYSNKFALKLISKDYNEPVKKLFMQHAKDESLDMILSIEGGGTELTHAKTVNTFDTEFYEFLKGVYDRDRPNRNKCISTLDGEMAKMKPTLLQQLREMSRIPIVASAHTGCCYYEPPAKVPSIWIEYSSSLLTLLFSSVQGFKAYVVDKTDRPMRLATASINDTIFNLVPTPNGGIFKRILPPGEYTIKFSCFYYFDKTVTVKIEPGKVSTIKVVMEAISSMAGPPQHLNFSGSGIIGFVLDQENRAIPNAQVSYTFNHVNGTVLKVNNTGAFWLPLPKDAVYSLTTTADGYIPMQKMISIVLDKPQMMIFSLTRDNRIMGMPRFSFIAISSIAIMMLLGIIFLGYSAMKDYRNRQRGFIPVPVKSSLFKDEDDADLYKTPLRGSRGDNATYNIMPYYDNSDYEDEYQTDSEEEIIVVNGGQIQRNFK